MNFVQHYFTEALGLSNEHYTVPENKEEILYDFYALSLINPDGLREEDAQIYFKEAYRTLINYLMKEFERVLVYAIACEATHLFSNTTVGEGTLLYLNAVENGYATQATQPSTRNDYNIFKSTFTSKEREFLLGTYSDVKNSANMKPTSRPYRYEQIIKYFDVFEVISLAKKVFSDKMDWSDNYGGEPWLKIADGLERLEDAAKAPIGKQMAVIDHVYDLQHNTSTIFEKVKEYYDEYSGCGWILAALDHKKYIKEPHVFMDHISSQLRRPYAYAVKELYGKSLDAFEKESRARLTVDIKEYPEEFSEMGGLELLRKLATFLTRNGIKTHLSRMSNRKNIPDTLLADFDLKDIAPSGKEVSYLDLDQLNLMILVIMDRYIVIDQKTERYVVSTTPKHVLNIIQGDKMNDMRFD